MRRLWGVILGQFGRFRVLVVPLQFKIRAFWLGFEGKGVQIWKEGKEKKLGCNFGVDQSNAADGGDF